MLVASELTCPYCFQVIAVIVDRSGGSQEYVEDCQVCCSPMRIMVRVDLQGEIESVEAWRENG